MSLDLREVMDRVPDSQGFLTIEELDRNTLALAEEYPQLVQVQEVGRSREGRIIRCLKIGSGSKNALLFACPHPNEPIGAMMLEAFSTILAEDAELREALDYTWYIIKSWDVDGTQLNEPWFKGPFSLKNYVRHFFRPAPTAQVDWTFPIDYKNLHFHDSIPETQAVQKLIDELSPSFLYSLHNSAFGGVYWYLTEAFDEDFYDMLRAVAAKHGMPIDLGEPEAPYIQRFSPAVYRNISMADSYDYYESYGAEHPEEMCGCGTCSADYGKAACGAFTLLTELP